MKLYDTAGIREATGTVEALGIERSFQAMADADLTLVVLDASTVPEAEDQRLIERARSAGRALVAANKSDLPRAAAPPAETILVSALTGDGIERLRQAILDAVAPAGVFEPETGFITSLRHEQLLRECGRWIWRKPAPRWAPQFPTKCSCWIFTPRCSPSTPSPAEPPPTIS